MLAKLIISGLFGLLYGGLSYAAFIIEEIPDALRLALVVGLAAFGLLLLYLQLRENRMFRRFEQAEKLLPGQPIEVLTANVREGQRIAGTRIYLYTGEICLLSLEKRGPVLTRIPPDRIRSATMASNVEMHLDLSDGRTLLILSPRMEELIHHLRWMGCSIQQPRT